MNAKKTDQDLKLILGIGIIALILVILSLFILPGTFPWVDAVFFGNQTQAVNGSPLDPAIQGVLAVEEYFTAAGKSLINGSLP